MSYKMKYDDKLKRLKKVEWINGNKMKFDSPFKTFNKQTNIISEGNIIANTVFGFFIRPYSEDKNPVGEKVEKGAMQKWDLDNFTNLPYGIREEVKNFTKEKYGILYEFKHYDNEGRKIVDGYVLTDYDYKLIKKWYVNSSWKSQGAVDEATKYVAWVKK